MNKRPDVSEYNPRYQHYMELVPENDIRAALGKQLKDTVESFRQIPESLVEYRYAPDKGTIREVLGHILDTERLLGFRLLSFARGDTTPLIRADEEIYVRNGKFDRFPMAEWIDEYSLIRKSNIALIRHLPEDAWDRTGTISGAIVSVRAIAYFILGHERHHLQILRDRYLGK